MPQELLAAHPRLVHGRPHRTHAAAGMMSRPTLTESGLSRPAHHDASGAREAVPAVGVDPVAARVAHLVDKDEPHLGEDSVTRRSIHERAI
jgi:hypothetical protein